MTDHRFDCEAMLESKYSVGTDIVFRMRTLLKKISDWKTREPFRKYWPLGLAFIKVWILYIIIIGQISNTF